MTKREMYVNIANLLADNTEVVEFCNHEVELLDNRKTSKRGMSATQKANVAIKETIATVLAEVGHAMTVTELLADERLHCYTNQKISALLRQMPEVVKIIEGKKAFFALATEEEEG